MMQIFKKLALVSSLSILYAAGINAVHSSNRYFPFLDRPEMFISKQQPRLSASAFLTISSSAYNRGGGASGIPELWGFYDLHDVINSLKLVQGNSFVNPITAVSAPAEWLNKSIKFKAESKISTQGLELNYDYPIKKTGLTIGAWIPFLHMSATSVYQLNQRDFANQISPATLSQAYVDKANESRRKAHEMLSFSNGWDRGGIGDLDVHARYNCSLDHRLLMKSISFCFQVGGLAPTGTKIDNNNPVSIPVMGGGHWGIYGDFLSEFELKQDWKLGLMFSDVWQFQKTEHRRLATFKEPMVYSALVDNVTIQPGNTFKLSPYFSLDNVADGLNFQFRYTYLKHSKDDWKSAQSSSIKNYLTQDTSTVIDSANLTLSEIANNITSKKDLTKWTAHFITFQLAYDTKEGFLNMKFDPKFFASWDVPFGGTGLCKTNQVTVGVDLHF